MSAKTVRKKKRPPKFTRLMKAAAAGSEYRVVDELAKEKKTLFEKDHKSRTARDWAKMKNHSTIEQILTVAMDEEEKKAALETEALNRREMHQALLTLNSRLRALLEDAVYARDSRRAARAVREATFSREDYEHAATHLNSSKNSFFLDIETETGETPLMLAADDEILARDMIQRGSDVNYENKRGYSCLSWACLSGHDRVVAMLLRSGADASRRSKRDGRTPLLYAAHNGHASVLQVLTERLFYDAQMSSRRRAEDEETEGIVIHDQDWLFGCFERALKYPDPETKLCARDLAASLGHEDAVAVLNAAHLRCEAHRAEVDHEQSLKTLVECPRNCGVLSIPKDQVKSHLLNDCILRPAGCDFCGSTLPLKNLEHHKRNECLSRHIRCEICGQDVIAARWKAHQNFNCPKRTVTCRQGCGLQLAAEKLSAHELTKCKYRGQPCMNPGCTDQVPLRLLKRHMEHECRQRRIKCSVGCGEMIPFEQLEHHENKVCVQLCRWEGCGRLIGPTQRRIVHELVECPRRRVECKFGCGSEDIVAEDQESHETTKCPNRIEKCCCGWEGPHKLVGAHRDSESGTCRERKLRCRYDLLGRRVEYRPSTETSDVERAVLRRYRQDDERFLIFGQNQEPRWTPLSALLDLKFVDTKQPWTCGWIVAKDMADHLAVCERGPRRAKASKDNGSQEYDGNETMSRKDFPATFKATNVVTSRRCKYGCGAAFPIDDVDELFEKHVREECPKRPIECVCGETIWAEEVESHEKICPVLAYVPPPPGKLCKCGEFVANADAAMHSSDCKAREFYCSQGCGEKGTAKALEEHLLKCPRRHLHHGLLVECPLGCGKEPMQFQLRWTHVTTECPRRIVACPAECGEQVLFCHLDEHKAVCPKRVVACGAGAEGCRRTLRSWILPRGEVRQDEDGEQNYLVSCDVHNATVLQFAVRSRDELLLDHVLQTIGGSDKDLAHESLDGHNSLTKACEMNWAECVEKLWRAGVDLNRETRRGRTPLIEAAKAGSLSTCRYLVERGAVIDKKSRHRTTAADWAKKAGHVETHRQLCRDMDVQRDMRQLFTLVTLADTDAIKDIVKAGEPYARGNLTKFVKELALEDSALKKASDAIFELTADDREEQVAVSLKRDARDRCKTAADRMECLADRVLAMGRKVRQAVDALLASGATALQRFGPPDVHELRSLRHTSVSAEVLEVLEACCEILNPDALTVPSDARIETQEASADSRYHRASRRGSSSPKMLPRDSDKSMARRWKRVQNILLNDTKLSKRLRFYSLANVAKPEAFARTIRTTFASRYPQAVELELAPMPEGDDDAIQAFVDDLETTAEKVSSASPMYPTTSDAEAFGGYELVTSLAAWVNGQVAALESIRVITHLEGVERHLRSTFYDERAPAAKRSSQEAFRAENKKKLLHQQLARARKEEEFRQHCVKACERKVRTARVLQKYAPNGHSLLTWACALGNARVVEVLLDHGACPGLPDDVEGSAIRVIQLVYRHHRWRRRISEKLTNVVNLAYASEIATERRLREATFVFILARQLSLYSELRMRIRVPLCEAAYNGHDAVFGAFKKMRLLPTNRRSMLVTACRPQPPTPFALREVTKSRSAFISIVDCTRLGRVELPRQHWQHGKAWIDEKDPSAPQEKTRVHVTEAWSIYLRALNQGTRKQDSRVRHRVQKVRRNLAVQDLVHSMYAGDFNHVSHLFDDGVVPVDYEDTSGSTPLIAAAGEDSELESRIQSLDVDKKPVLAVVLLLDRRKRRPKVDTENRRGETAFIVACVKGRLDVAAALLERGADVNYQSTRGSRVGWTPLRWTVEVNGRSDTINFLIERGADVDAKAKDGLTAYAAAILGQHVDATAALSRYRSADFGLASATPGAAHKSFPCPNGCGSLLCGKDRDAHCATICPKRSVTCGECGMEMWAEELVSHLENICPVARVVTCPLRCGASFRAEFSDAHARTCKNRVVACDLCGMDVRETRLQAHQIYFCPARPSPKGKPERMRPLRCEHCGQYVSEASELEPEKHDCPTVVPVNCPNRCGERLLARDLPYHLASVCENRWEVCDRCGVKVRHRDLVTTHLNGPLSTRCGLSVTACPNQCGQSMPLRQLDLHKAFMCPRRLVPCALCGKETEFLKSQMHKEFDCPYRSVECPNLRCTIRLPLKNMKKHAQLECKKRMVRCGQGCGELVCAQRLARHHDERCSFRYVDCPLGCSKRIRAKDLVEHVKSDCVRRR